jgi:hypothetical protein
MSVQTPEQFAASMDKIARNFPQAMIGSIDATATRSQANIRRNAPVDTGDMQRNVLKDKPGGDVIRVYAAKHYSNPVDKGHRTRQGTGRAPGYVPKPGGISFVKANPFFTKEVNELKQGKLAREMKEAFKTIIVNQFTGRG